MEQLEGSGFGYKVRPALSGEKEDLSAFMVAVPSDSTETTGRLGLKNAQGSVYLRDIVIVQPRRDVAAFCLAISPAVAWLIFAAIARQRRKAPAS